MAKSKNIVKAGTDFANSGELDLLGLSKNEFEEIKLNNVSDRLVYLAALYIDKIIENADKKDISSSGFLQRNIKPTDVEIDGSKFSIFITAPDYLSYQDEGVDGWAQSRGSRFKFKTKGVDPDGEMVKSIKDWLSREKSMAANVKVGITNREIRGKGIKDAATQRAVTAAYMIKRQGIAGKHFLRDATQQMQLVIQNELGEAFKADIILNLTQ
jgi:hypothetical protein